MIQTSAQLPTRDSLVTIGFDIDTFRSQSSSKKLLSAATEIARAGQNGESRPWGPVTVAASITQSLHLQLRNITEDGA